MIAESLARRDRLTVLLALAAVVAASAVFMQSAGDALMRAPQPGSFGYVILLFAMWWTMMLAMMLPSAAPAILTFAALAKRRLADPEKQVALFSGGYAAMWTGFSLAATGLHLLIAAAGPMTPMMAVAGRALGGCLLVAAGVYQLTPLKQACLRHCQSPLFYFARNWRGGPLGTLRMGLGHGVYCLGCCAVLMGVLFYGGAMEPAWIGGLALYVLVEKLVPAGWRLARFTGLLLIAWGGAVMLSLL